MHMIRMKVKRHEGEKASGHMWSMERAQMLCHLALDSSHLVGGHFRRERLFEEFPRPLELGAPVSVGYGV